MKSCISRQFPRVFACATIFLASVAFADDTLKVMSYNVLLGGNPFAKTAQVIQASGADLVGIQESDGNTASIAALLGWNFRVFSADFGAESGNTDSAILSRFPITQTLRTGVRVQVAAGKEAFVFDTHLAAYPYQPYDLRDHLITTEAQAIAGANSARSAQINAVLGEAAPYIASGRAVFLTGDMNEPSHLDWTEAAATAGIHAIKVAWPASTATVNAGFRDSYRLIHPNAVTFPGNTWTPMPAANEVHDRIDFVYSAGAGVTTTNSQIVGESTTKADIVVPSYPSDHRALVSTFTTTPGALAPLRTGINLISNGGAEANPGTASGQDRVLVDWESNTANTAATAQLYNHGLPSDAVAERGVGANYFYGGSLGGFSPETHAIRQRISVADLTQGIDLGFARYGLSGIFGGVGTQSDTASLTATFLDASGQQIGSILIGNPTAASRQNITRLLSYSAGGQVPPLTQNIDVVLRFTKGSEDTFNDGSADNLSLVITMVPEPASMGALICCLALLSARRGPCRWQSRCLPAPACAVS